MQLQHLVFQFEAALKGSRVSKQEEKAAFVELLFVERDKTDDTN